MNHKINPTQISILLAITPSLTRDSLLQGSGKNSQPTQLVATQFKHPSSYLPPFPIINSSLPPVNRVLTSHKLAIYPKLSTPREGRFSSRREIR